MTQTIQCFRDDFRASVSAHPDTVAVIDAATGRTFSWADLDRLTRRTGAWLGSYGLSPNDVILCMLPNSVEMLVLFMACLRHGLSFAPLPPSASKRDIQHLDRLVSPRLVVALSDADGHVAQAAEGAKLAFPELDLGFAWLPNDEVDPRPGDDLSSKLYIATSGSTGEPKMIVIDGDTLWSAGRAFVGQHKFLGAHSRFYNTMPMSYLGGLFNLGLIPLACGGSTVVSSAFSGSTILRFWHEVSRHNVNVLWLVPTMIKALIQVTGPRWKPESLTTKIVASFLGTAPIDMATKDQFEKLFGISLIENFGLSETTFLTSEMLDTRANRTDRSVGEILPWAEIRLVPQVESDDGRQFHRVQVRTPYLFDGYLGTDGLTLPVDGEGWFDTGDLGHLECGRLVLDGRTRDVIKKGGILVHLPEIEMLAKQCLGVTDAAVVDVVHPFYGEDYALFAVFDDKLGGTEAERVAGLREFIGENLVNSKWPAHILAVSAIPRTTSGKVARPALRDMVAAGVRQ